MFLKNKLTLAIFGSLALAIPVLSEAASHRKIVYIDQYDQNMDGRVSSLEFETARRSRFDITDTNQNGSVDAEEYVFEWEDRLDDQLALDRQEQVSQTSTRFGSLDDNEDALISWEEYEASGQWSFNRFDSNGDGVINEDDVDGMAEQVAETNTDMTREQILHDSKRMLEMPSTHNKAGTITQYDDDGDGMVITAEFVGGRLAFYKAMDENGDEGVDADEYLAEFENRVDAEISRYRKNSVKQAYVRFGALDDDENSVMTFKEYQASGHRSFARWDTDGDGYVTLEEADPVSREFTRQQVEAESQAKS